MFYGEKRLRGTLRALLFAASIAVYACVLPVFQAYEEETQEVFSATVPYQAMTRDQTRSLAVETLAQLSADETLPAEQRQDAPRRLEDILLRAQQEADIETELMARGFGASVANVAAGFVSVMLETDPDAAAAAAIMETVGRITGCAPGDIRLIPLSMV